jgi:hypothetical protein
VSRWVASSGGAKVKGHARLQPEAHREVPRHATREASRTGFGPFLDPRSEAGGPDPRLIVQLDFRSSEIKAELSKAVCQSQIA